MVGGVPALGMRLAPNFDVKGDAAFSDGSGLVRRTTSDINFVTVWVIFVYLLFELSVYFLRIDPKVAVVATLYSAVPAIILPYGWVFWME